MISNEILKADMLDILFDNRNKQYGAYVLRKNYNNRLGSALGLSLSMVLLVFFLARIDDSPKISRPVVEEGTLIVKTIKLPDIKQPDPVIPKQAIPTPRVKQTAFMNPVIKDDRFVKNPVPDQKELIKSLISNINAGGIDPSDMPVLKQTPPSGSVVKEEPKTNSDIVPVEREPEFPGGQEAWLNFLRKNLIAPEGLEPGEKKTVAIRFLVSADGTVAIFQVLQSAGKVFDNEVIRVLKKMPKWKPAIQNGQPAARAFTQPVTFVGVEQ
jgi:protein TonB